MDTIQRFRIDGVLGEGGMGTVYRAYDPELERAVAIKVLVGAPAPLEVLDEHQTVNLREAAPRSPHALLAEARVMAAISHPNVLPVFEVGRLGEQVFLVMELIEGIDLRRWLVDRRPAEILDVLGAAARGLAAAHAKGVVHGDFKPDNVLIGEGRVCVADFGVSAFVHGPRASLVRVDDARGTPAYLAPELWRGEPVTPAADVYAFAMTAAEALLGGRPVPPQEPAAHDDLVRRLVARGAPPHVAATIARGMAAEPAARPTDLVEALHGPPRRRTRRWRLPAIAGGLVAAGAIGALVATRDGDGPTCRPVPDANWSPARAAALRERQIAEAHITAIADRIAEADALRTRTCDELAAGTLGTTQYTATAICLDRLAIEYDERIAVALASPAQAKTMLGSPPPAADCRTRRDIVFDPVKQRAIVSRFLTNIGMGGRALADELAAQLEVALAAGDRNLAARIGIARGLQLSRLDDLRGAREAFQHARGHARDAGSTTAELAVVTWHLHTERNHDELALARGLADDAKALIGRVPQGWSLVERTLQEIAELASTRGEYADAAEADRRLLAILEATNRGTTTEALECRLRLVGVTPKLDGPVPAGFTKFLADTHAMFDRTYRDKASRAYVLGLFVLAGTYLALDDPRGSVMWSEGIERVRELAPEAGLDPIAHKAAIAFQLYVRDRQEEGIAMLRELVAPPAGPAANRRATQLAMLAMMLFTVGRPAEAREAAEDALLEVTGKFGPTHAETRRILDLLATIALEQGDVLRAERHVTQYERALGTPPEPVDQAYARVLRAELARTRGDLANAEQLAREALASMTELGAKPSRVRDAERQLGRALVALDRPTEAYPHLLAGRVPLEKQGLFECKSELELGRVERAVGKRAAGDARVRACAKRIAHLPGLVALRAEIEAWLAAP